MKCTKCGEEADLYCNNTLCSCCIMAGQEEAIKKNPEYYSQEDNPKVFKN